MKIFLFIVILFFNSYAFAQDSKEMTSSTVIFDQKIEHNVPHGWKPVFENAGPAHYILEFTPENQTKENWTEMFTVQGFKGLAERAEPEVLLGLTGKMHKDFCNNNVVFIILENEKIRGFPAKSAIIGCTGVSKNNPVGLKEGMSEVAHYTAVKGKQDMYLFHKAVRGGNLVRKALPINRTNAKTFIEDFKPFKLCDKKSQFNECLE